MIKTIKIKGYAYFITTRLDGNLSTFYDGKCCQILLNDLDYYLNELGYLIYGYVIMPDHFHWIVHPIKKVDISIIMNKIKGHSSFEINKHLGRNGKLWQRQYYDHVIRNGRDFEEKINYMHRNPVRARLVENLADYMYSSYRNYYLGENSLIKIDIPKYGMLAK